MPPNLPSSPGIVIIGAGAAGIGAGLALTRLGIPFVILEAKDRIGGRAYSDDASIGHQWDQGCHWFHAAEKNPLRMIADRLGHAYVAKAEDWWRDCYDDGRLMSAEQNAGVAETVDAALSAAHAAGGSGRDISQAAAAKLAPPYGNFARFVFEAIGSGPADDISAVDSARYDGGDNDYSVSGGYGRLIERMAAGLPIRTGCPVEAVTAAPGGLAVATPQGTLRPRAVILTVSTSVLAAGRIKFEPGLPSAVQSAIGDLPCGSCEKIAVELTGDALPDITDGKLIARLGGDIFSLQVRPVGRPIVTSYLGGEHAQRMSALTDADAGAALGEVLASVYGSAIKRNIGRAKVTRWSADPHVLGAYSYARAGRAAARPALIEADMAPLFLAGEAMTLNFFSTCHGAHISGVQTAHKAVRHLGHAAVEPDVLWLPETLTQGRA